MITQSKQMAAMEAVGHLQIGLETAEGPVDLI